MVATAVPVHLAQPEETATKTLMNARPATLASTEAPVQIQLALTHVHVKPGLLVLLVMSL